MSEIYYEPTWKDTRQMALLEHGHECQHCARGVLRVEQLHVHHIKPRAAGGSDKLDNLTVLCRACHQKLHGEFESEHERLPPALLEGLDWWPPGQLTLGELRGEPDE